MRTSLERLGGERGWRCWLCGGSVAPVLVALLVGPADAALPRGLVVERAGLVLDGCWEAAARRNRSWWTVSVRCISS
jgi:hypothetical protein